MGNSKNIHGFDICCLEAPLCQCFVWSSVDHHCRGSTGSNQKHITLAHITSNNVPVVIDSATWSRPKHCNMCHDGNHKDHRLSDASDTSVLTVQSIARTLPCGGTIIEFHRRFRATLRTQESNHEDCAG